MCGLPDPPLACQLSAVRAEAEHGGHRGHVLGSRL